MKVIKAQLYLLSNTVGPVGEIEKTLSDKIFTAVTQTQKKNCAASTTTFVKKSEHWMPLFKGTIDEVLAEVTPAVTHGLRSLQLSLRGC